MADFSSSNLPDEVVQFDSGTKQWFYQAAALAVHGSSSYSGSGSGGVQAGTWTQPNHTHTVDIYASDKTGTILSHGAESITAIATDANDVSWELEAGPASYSGKGKRETTAGGATANTWRPFANVGIIASKD
jgi:hypothetical protein